MPNWDARKRSQPTRLDRVVDERPHVRARLAQPECRLDDRDDARRRHSLVVIRGARAHVDVRIDESHWGSPCLVISCSHRRAAPTPGSSRGRSVSPAHALRAAAPLRDRWPRPAQGQPPVAHRECRARTSVRNPRAPSLSRTARHNATIPDLRAATPPTVRARNHTAFAQGSGCGDCRVRQWAPVGCRRTTLSAPADSTPPR